MNVEWST